MTLLKSLPRWPSLLLLATLSLLLSACGSGATFSATSWPGLAADETTAYVAYNEAVYAVNLSDGRLAWKFPVESDRNRTFFAPPTVAGDLLIVGGYDQMVYALDPKNSGAERWRFEGADGRIIGGAAATEDLVLVPTAHGTLYALNRQTGTLRWSFSTSQPLWSAPLVVEDRVYLSALDHNVYALKLSDGGLIWQQDLGDAIADTPTLVDDILLVGTFGSQLNALRASDGKLLWTFETEEWVWGNPAIWEDLALFGDVAGNLYALSLQTRQALWTFQPDGAVAASPLVEEGRVYFVVEEGTVYSRQARDNAPLWQATVPGRLLAEPVLTGDLLLVATIDKDVLLVALNKETGGQIWSFSPQE